MAVSTMNGTTFGVSAVLPATFDAAGYGALTFVLAGEIVDVGEIAKAFNEITHQAVDKDYPTKLKGTYNIGNLSLTLGKVDADAGQVILQTALDGAASVSFELTLPSGATANLTGKVMKAGIGAIKSDGVETTVVDIAVDPETLYEA